MTTADPAQLTLLGIDAAPAKKRRQHRYAPPDAGVWQCRVCSCLKRYAPTGPKQGAKLSYSTNGGESWVSASPNCFIKR